MPQLWRRTGNRFRLLALGANLMFCLHCSAAGAEPAWTVPTFHCMSLYWPQPPSLAR